MDNGTQGRAACFHVEISDFSLDLCRNVVGVTITKGLGRVGGDGEGLLAGERGVFAVPPGKYRLRARRPGASWLRAVCLGSAASAQPETRLLRTATAAFPGRMPSPGLLCRVYPCTVTHPWEN